MRTMSKSWIGHALGVAAAILMLFAAATRPAISESHGEQTIVGEVWSEEFDDDGNVTAVSIYDSTWGTVMVSPEGKGGELLARVGANVEATGEVQSSEEAGYVIVVTSYRIIEGDR